MAHPGTNRSPAIRPTSGNGSTRLSKTTDMPTGLHGLPVDFAEAENADVMARTAEMRTAPALGLGMGLGMGIGLQHEDTLSLSCRYTSWTAALPRGIFRLTADDDDDDDEDDDDDDEGSEEGNERQEQQQEADRKGGLLLSLSCRTLQQQSIGRRAFSWKDLETSCAPWDKANVTITQLSIICPDSHSDSYSDEGGGGATLTCDGAMGSCDWDSSDDNILLDIKLDTPRSPSSAALHTPRNLASAWHPTAPSSTTMPTPTVHLHHFRRHLPRQSQPQPQPQDVSSSASSRTLKTSISWGSVHGNSISSAGSTGNGCGSGSSTGFSAGSGSSSSSSSSSSRSDEGSSSMSNNLVHLIQDNSILLSRSSRNYSEATASALRSQQQQQQLQLYHRQHLSIPQRLKPQKQRNRSGSTLELPATRDGIAAQPPTCAAVMSEQPQEMLSPIFRMSFPPKRSQSTPTLSHLVAGTGPLSLPLPHGSSSRSGQYRVQSVRDVKSLLRAKWGGLFGNRKKQQSMPAIVGSPEGSCPRC